ncbi:CsbD family protein [Nonomuraea polychroma]|uniref:CsbD family protein n=1 Tax=Nonomuraea TaxID=83681 RepID=UPI003D8D3100
MSLRWEISNKVQVLKGWARQRFGRVTGNRRQQIAGKSDRVAGNLKQAGRKARDAFKR